MQQVFTLAISNSLLLFILPPFSFRFSRLLFFPPSGKLIHRSLQDDTENQRPHWHAVLHKVAYRICRWRGWRRWRDENLDRHGPPPLPCRVHILPERFAELIKSPVLSKPVPQPPHRTTRLPSPETEASSGPWPADCLGSLLAIRRSSPRRPAASPRASPPRARHRRGPARSWCISDMVRCQDHTDVDRGVRPRCHHRHARSWTRPRRPGRQSQ